LNTYFLPTGIRLNLRAIIFGLSLFLPSLAGASEVYLEAPDETAADDIEIVAGEDRTIFEYRTNGILMMIKVVPRNGKPYYMVPAEGAPHFESLDHSKKLYPQWVILEW
jgi:hypothetical protein